MHATALPASRMPSGEPPYMPDKWNHASKEILRTHNCYTYMLNDLYVVPRIHGKPQPGHFSKGKRDSNRFSRLSCREVRKGVIADNEHIEVIPLERGRKHRCRKEHYKGIMIMSPGRDYHFARQDNRMIPVYRAFHRMVKRKSKPLLYTVDTFLQLAKKLIPDIFELAKTRCRDDCTPKQLLREVFKCSRTWSHKPGGTEVTDKDASGDLILDPEKANWDYSHKGGVNYYITCCYFSIPNNNIAYTRSSGISFWGSPLRDNPLKVRTDISTLKNVDAYYENVLKKALK